MHLQEVAKVVRVEVGGHRLVLIPAILWRRGGLKRFIAVLTPHYGGRCDPQPLPCLRVSQSQSSALTDQCRPASGTAPRYGGIARCTSRSPVGFTGHTARFTDLGTASISGTFVLVKPCCSQCSALKGNQLQHTRVLYCIQQSMHRHAKARGMASQMWHSSGTAKAWSVRRYCLLHARHKSERCEICTLPGLP